MTLSLTDLAARVHLESPKEAERHLLEMVRQCSFLLLLFIP